MHNDNNQRQQDVEVILSIANAALFDLSLSLLLCVKLAHFNNRIRDGCFPSSVCVEQIGRNDSGSELQYY